MLPKQPVLKTANERRIPWRPTAAVVIFWPAAFLIKGDGANAAELARLKGELEAIEKTSVVKNCNISFKSF